MNKIIFKNIWLKLLALFFATALWFLVVGERGTEIGLLVPLELKDIPEGMVVTNNPPREIEVRVTGPRALLSNLSPGQISAVLDLHAAVPGTKRYYLTPDDIKAPRGIHVKRLNPTYVKIKTEKLKRKKIPVRIRLEGKPPEGFKIKEVKSDPQSVEVTGTIRQLEGLKSINTKKLNLTNIKRDVNIKQPLELPEKGVSKVSPNTVNISIVIEEVGAGK